MKQIPILLTTLTSLLFSFIEGLLALRIILKFFGANSQTPFVTWTYSTTEPLLNPFLNIFPSPSIQGLFLVEFSALFALIVYIFIGYLFTTSITTMIALNEKK